MQNPAYRMQTTIRGYYQTADVDFYMAADMPQPPVAPVQTADVYLTDGSAISAAHNGKSVMLDIRNANTNISLNENVALSRLWLMNPKGHNYSISGTGKLTGAMDVVKSMQGDVVFNGNYDYTGKTRISEGRLFINGTLASPVQLDARGVIGGNATLNGGITLETGLNVEGGRIEPGNGATLGNLTVIGNLSLPGRNNLAFDIDLAKAEKNDRLNIQGDLTVTGSNHSIIIKTHNAVSPAVLTLVTFTGTTNATKDNFTVKGLEGIPYTLIFESNAIKLEVSQPRSAGKVSWNGSKSTVWDFQTKNFLNGSAEDIFVPGDSVMFNDDATSKIVTVNETMPVSGVSFANNSDYKISGEGVITGACGLIKTGTGKLSLLTDENSFTGGIDFADGILEVSSLKDGGLSSSIGASSGDASNWIMRNASLQTAGQMSTTRNMKVYGKLTVNNPASNNSVLIGGNITGDNISLELNGAGTLSLQGTNTFNSVVVKSGTLSLASVAANSNSVGSGTVTLAGGTLQMRDANTSTTVGPWINTIDVPEGASAKWNLPMRWNFTNVLTGKGTLSVNIPYVRDEFRGDWSAFEGTLKVTTGSSGEFRINNTYGYGNAVIDLSSGINFFHLSTGKTIKLGGLSGAAGSKLGGSSTTWVVGGKNISGLTFAGVISGTSTNLVKEETGTFILTGVNTYTGTTNVTGGTLVVANTSGSATGTGAVTVNAAALAGTGIITGTVTANSGAVIEPGSNSIGTLTVGALTMQPGSKMSIEVSGASSDKVAVTGALDLKGTLEMTNTGAPYTAGSSYTIFNAASVTGSFDAISPSSPGNGLVWNTSRLNEGIISVDITSGTKDVSGAQIVVYPNPVKDICNVTIGALTGQVKIELCNEVGAVVFATQADASNGKQEINMSNLKSGIYFVKITSGGESIMRKIVKF